MENEESFERYIDKSVGDKGDLRTILLITFTSDKF